MAEFTPKRRPAERTSWKTVSFHVEESFFENLDRLAKEYSLSRSDFVRQCVTFAIDHLDEGKP